jgi:hypothetical protein
MAAKRFTGAKRKSFALIGYVKGFRMRRRGRAQPLFGPVRNNSLELFGPKVVSVGVNLSAGGSPMTDADNTDIDAIQTDEEILTYDLSDEALEAAAGSERGAADRPFHTYNDTPPCWTALSC